MFLDNESVKDNLIKYKCLSCNKDNSNKMDEELKKRFKNTFTFSNNDANKFILLLTKAVYPYECMNEKFNETTLPEKEKQYSNLNTENITDTDYIIVIRRKHSLAIFTAKGLFPLNSRNMFKTIDAARSECTNF